MILNKWHIFKPLLCSTGRDFEWKVDAAKNLGDIYLRPEVSEINIMVALSHILSFGEGNFDQKYYGYNPQGEHRLKEEMIHVTKTKQTKICVVNNNTRQPLLVLLRDGSWR